MRRRIAHLTTWWQRAFIASIVVPPFLGMSFWVQLALLVGTFALSVVRPPRDPDRAPLEVLPPVRGRWAALNSPGTKVPSHGVHSLAQTYAIDVLHPRPPGTPTSIGWGRGMEPPDARSTFGEPVHAVADGVVAVASDGRRDHRTRLTWPSLLYMMVVEGMLRELGGPRFMLGNHVVIDHEDGTYSAFAHLRRGSLRVAVGERVLAGQQLGEVGNSGNSSEPHLHVQLMDRAEPSAAAGLPFRWVGIEIEPATDPTIAGDPPDDPADGLPATGQIFTTTG